MPCISVVSIEQRLRKCGFQGIPTRKFENQINPKPRKLAQIVLFLHKMLMKYMRARARTKQQYNQLLDLVFSLDLAFRFYFLALDLLLVQVQFLGLDFSFQILVLRFRFRFTFQFQICQFRFSQIQLLVEIQLLV